jgi:hypothetical protein
MLLDRRGLVALAQLLDVGRGVVAPDVLQGSAKTTKLYDRREDDLTLDEAERIIS